MDPLEQLGDDTWSSLAQLARALHLKNAELRPTLDAIVACAVQTIEPAEHAGLILIQGGRLVPQATLGEPPQLLDALQQATDAGPCVEAARAQTVVAIADTVTDSRWPEFGARACELGVASMLCVPLWVDDLRLGALSLYGRKPDAFGVQDRQLTTLFATHAAVALADAQRATQLREALHNRDVIGQAKGILMERMKITSKDAFGRLSHASQQTNLKLTVVAQHLVDTGQLLSDPE